MTSTSPPTPGRTTPEAGAGSISQLRAKVAAQTEADQQALTQAAQDQMAAMSSRMQATLDEHVNAWNRHVSVALNTTQRAIDLDLSEIRSSVWRASTARWRWLVWPPIASLAISALVLVLTLWWTHGWVQGIPSTQIDQKGQTMQVLTDSNWTTCRWQGEKHPCRPVLPAEE